MNERIKELAKQAGFVLFSSEEDTGEPIDWSCDYTEELKKFAELIRADEREACAEICDGISEWYETRTDLNQTQKQVGQLATEVCGVRIRERNHD